MQLTRFILLCLTVFGLSAFHFTPPSETFLCGTITDSQGESLPGVTVKITQKNVFVKGGCSDFNGQYRIALAPGTYDIVFSYTGYPSIKYTNVEVHEKKIKTLDVRLRNQETDEVIMVKYSRPAIQPDRQYTGQEFTTREAEKLPAYSKNRSLAKDAGAIESAKKAPDKAIATDDIALAPATEETAGKLDGAPNPGAGLLTAGEWNDLHNWNRHWLDLQADGEIDPYQNMYGFYPKHRFTALLSTTQDFPIIDAPIRLLDAAGNILWEARTDNTGKAELWAGFFQPEAVFDNAGLSLQAEVHGQKHDLGRPKTAKEGINRYQFQVDCQAPKQVDIVWMVDATGSMGDEIEYLKTELLDVIGRAKSRNAGLNFRMGTVFYRDHGDEYLTRSSELSANINQTIGFIQNQYAGGGGDTPEAVHNALEEAIFKQAWSRDAVARICFVVLDASPHQSPEINANLQKSIREAARLGIRIIPIAASGIQKDTEFLMKFFGLATNGTYVFLTDHSGIGNKHLEPTTDEYKVELLNELLVRIISEYTALGTCEGHYAIQFEQSLQQAQQQSPALEARYYPNPADRQFTLELPTEVESVILYNSEGKAVRKIEKPQAGIQMVLVSDLPEGFYTIRILKDGKMQSGKLMVVRA